MYWWFVFLLILHFSLIHIWIHVSQWLWLVFFPNSRMLWGRSQSRFRGGFGAAPGRVPRWGTRGGSGSAPGGSGPAFWPCPGGSRIVREVPAMLLGVSVQVPVQCVFLKVLLKGIEFSIGMQSGSFAFWNWFFYSGIYRFVTQTLC